MIDISIPGFGDLHLAHLVMDYNGTLAVDGQLLPGVRERLDMLSEKLALHVVTADTFGKVRSAFQNESLTVSVLSKDSQDQAKLTYIQKLGADSVVAMGNGRNDRLMLKEAALGIGLILGEGASSATLVAADAVYTSITEALDGLLYPLRLTATLRC